jgi:AcrR family transcriptional regulator
MATATHTRLGREERRAAILDGATVAFAAGGYAGTSMAEIAAAAGVSHLIVYRHFAGKEELYEAVLQRARATLAAELEVDGAFGRYGPTPGALLAAARADVAAFRVLWRHAAREPEFARLTDAARSTLLRSTSDALRTMVGPDLLRWASRATVAFLVDAVLVWIEDGEPRYDERFIAATEAALRAGIRSWAKPE